MPFAFRRVFNTDVVLAPSQGPGPLPCRLGRWRLETFLGGGPLSKTFRAVRTHCWPLDPHVPRRAAIKILRKRWSTDALTLAQFASESAIARDVKHPRLATVVETQLHRPPYYLVLPWLCGATLADLAARSRATGQSSAPLPSLIRWLRQTAEALHAIHAAGWMHADVKPANVLIDTADDATLLDLGFARRIRVEDESSPHARTSSHDPLQGTVVGTPFYMSPEMSATPAETDGRSDLYSLGAAAFELLAGRPPFTTRVPWKLIEEHRSAPAPLELLRHCPGELTSLIGELLSKQPNDRPPSANAVARRLAQVEVELGAATLA